jgi:hypothetical protein
MIALFPGNIYIYIYYERFKSEEISNKKLEKLIYDLFYKGGENIIIAVNLLKPYLKINR